MNSWSDSAEAQDQAQVDKISKMKEGLKQNTFGGSFEKNASFRGSLGREEFLQYLTSDAAGSGSPIASLRPLVGKNSSRPSWRYTIHAPDEDLNRKALEEGVQVGNTAPCRRHTEPESMTLWRDHVDNSSGGEEDYPLELEFLSMENI